MSLRRRAYLMTSNLVVASLLAAPFQAMAQDAGPPPDQEAYGQSQSEDPPARVGRVAVIEGTVSSHAGGETQWSPAVLNAPAADGDAFWTEPQALAELEVTSSSIWMNGGTEFDLTALNDAALRASEPQGETYLHLRALAPGETYTIETPRGTVTLGAEGQYDIVAGDQQTPTMVTVLSGSAQITGQNIALQVHEDQTASITGDTTYQGSVGPMVRDDFIGEMLRREQPARARGVAPPPVVAQMTGGADLVSTGEWSASPDYGQVWYPPVAADWAPYREGRWSYVAPWGWTWVDAAPWGFAPFHYGRWVQVGPRWGWVPVYPGYTPAYRPVYAPALVSFFGVGAGIGIGVGIGVGFGLGRGPAFGIGSNIGWVPLGPREPYFPPYRASRVYVNRVNVTNIRNVTNIYNEVGQRRGMAIDRFQNGRAAVIVPGRAMAESRPIAGVYRRPSPGDLAAARPLVDRAPIAPSGRTLGLAPRVAQRLNVHDVAERRAPGPQVGPGEQRGPGRQPALRPPENGPAGRVGGRPATLPNTGLTTGPNGGPGAQHPGAEGGRPAGLPEQNRPGGAPGPRIGQRDNATARPGERPALRPHDASPVNQPDAVRPGESRAGQTRRQPAGADQPDRQPDRQLNRQPDRQPGSARPDAAPGPRPRPEGVPHPQAARPESRPERRPIEHAQPRPIERAQPRPVERPQPRPEMARPIEHAPPPRVIERPQPRPEMARPEPRPPMQARPEPPRIQPRPEPRPEPKQERHDQPPHG